MSDIIADMLIRIKNGQVAKLARVKVPHSIFRKNILQVIKEEGYIKGFEEVKAESGHKEFIVSLKYVGNKAPVIRDIRKVSKLGCRVYSSIKSLRGYYNNFGITILSTSKGVMADNKARQANVGGEVICQIF